MGNTENKTAVSVTGTRRGDAQAAIRWRGGAERNGRHTSS